MYFDCELGVLPPRSGKTPLVATHRGARMLPWGGLPVYFRNAVALVDAALWLSLPRITKNEQTPYGICS